MWINCGFGLLCFISLVFGAATFPKDMTDAQRLLLFASYGGFTTSLGAFVGLLGGRAAGPDGVKEPK